jgi:cobalt-zinc-cadmium efflux system membrane fusion protein
MFGKAVRLSEKIVRDDIQAGVPYSNRHDARQQARRCGTATMTQTTMADRNRFRHGCGVGPAAVFLALILLAPPAGAEGEKPASPPAKGDDFVRVMPEQLHQLDVITVENHRFRARTSAIGQIAFNEDFNTPVLTPFPGRVIRLFAKPGDVVKPGDPLLEIDSPDVLQPQNDFIASIAALNKARSQHSLAQIAENRARTLYEGKAGPLKDWQQTQAQLAVAQNDLRSADTALSAARSRLRIIGRTEEEIEALQDKGIISRTATIAAPIAGTVVARKVGPGQYVRSDTGDPLYIISDLSLMWLKAFVPENDIPAIHIGQDVDVKVLALPERVFKARVVAIGAASDSNTRRVVVRSEVPNPDGLLKSDMFASFTIATGDIEESPGVTVEAVVRHGEEAAVWVQQDQVMFRRRLVKLGIEQDDRIQIREGLKAGERILARGAIFVDNEWRQ